MKMPKDEIDINMFAPCGMNCIVCYRHCYHKKTCAGCLNSDNGKSEHCGTCKIKNCIKENHAIITWFSLYKNVRLNVFQSGVLNRLFFYSMVFKVDNTAFSISWSLCCAFSKVSPLE